MAVDNTHTKYLKGKDKKAWNNYKEEREKEKKTMAFFAGFGAFDMDSEEDFEPTNKVSKK